MTTQEERAKRGPRMARTSKKQGQSKAEAAPEPKIHCRYDTLLDVACLTPHPANPARHPDKQVELLATIMRTHGIRHCISVSKRSGFVVSGHCRMMAAKKLGLKTFPVTYQEFRDENEELAVLVADNQIAELATVDGSRMGDILVELDRVDYPLQLTALTEEQIVDYVEGPTGTPRGTSAAEKHKCPKCGHEW